MDESSHIHKARARYFIQTMNFLDKKPEFTVFTVLDNLTATIYKVDIVFQQFYNLDFLL